MLWLCIYRKQWWIVALSLSLFVNLLLESKGGEPTSMNVALNKSTRQSSSYHSLGHAHHVVDGNTDQHFYHGSCTATHTEFNPYWEVDLGDIYFIDEIIIYPRLDCCMPNTRDVLVERSIDSTNYHDVCFHSGMLPSLYSCTPDNPELGRWVKVSLQAVLMLPLKLCEVQVMSKQAVNRDEFKLVEYVKGSGTAIQRISARSQLECACICRRNKNCISINVIQDNLSSTGIMCELLKSNVTSAAPSGNVSYWSFGDLV